MPLRYKEGDKVIVRRECRNGDNVNGVHFVYEMENYRGKVVTISSVCGDNRYRIKEDSYNFTWVGEFFEPANATFVDDNVVLLRNGQIRLVYANALYLPNGTCIEAENYTERKHNFDENFDIVEVHRKATGNYKFDLSGELIQEEN